MKLRSICITIMSGLLLAGCMAKGTAKTNTAMPVRTFVFECAEAYRFPVRIEGGRAWLFLTGQTISLPQVQAASGTKYSDGKTTFWSIGDEARYETPGGADYNCRNNRALAIWEHAKFNGVDFRAVGNEPGWHLEITRGRKIVFVSDYGQRRYEFDTPEPESKAVQRTTLYRTGSGDHTLEVSITGQPCRDTMRGDRFESTVTVTLDNQTYRGCGKALH